MQTIQCVIFGKFGWHCWSVNFLNLIKIGTSSGDGLVSSRFKKRYVFDKSLLNVKLLNVPESNLILLTRQERKKQHFLVCLQKRHRSPKNDHWLFTFKATSRWFVYLFVFPGLKTTMNERLLLKPVNMLQWSLLLAQFLKALSVLPSDPGKPPTLNGLMQSAQLPALLRVHVCLYQSFVSPLVLPGLLCLLRLQPWKHCRDTVEENLFS